MTATGNLLARLAAFLVGYWLLAVVAFVRPLVAGAYGGSWGEAMRDVRERILAGYRRQFEYDARVFRLLSDANYTGRMAIRCRQVAKSLRRGRIGVAAYRSVSIPLAVCLGPFAGAAEAALLYPMGRALVAWLDYIKFRHVDGHSVRWSLGAVAQTFEIVASAWSRVYIARELRRLRRAHRRARPTWAEARKSWLAAARKRQQRAEVVIVDPMPQPAAWLPPITNHRLN